MIDRVFGNYRIVARLGDGGMGSVFRAVDQMLDREVAIKVLRPDLARESALVERFRQEAKALARLSHPNIATLHGLEQHGADLLMIMEYVRGETLEAIVERSGRLAWPRACELCIGVLQALDHAHDMSVVHRDIKPANIMLASNGTVKVMDFGIARMLGRNRQTQYGHAVGTPLYMAPEQLRGQEVDGRTDLYAVGTVLFELITGRMAFDADSDYSLMMKKLNDPPSPPSLHVADVPTLVDALVLRAMHTEPAHRFPNAQAFIEEIQRALALAPARVARTTPAATRLAVDPPPVAVAASPVAETRLADLPITQSPPVRGTDPAIQAPPTRLAAPTPSATSVASNRWSDWRSYAVASVLLVAAAFAVSEWRTRPAAARSLALVDSMQPVALDEAPPAKVVPREDASSLIIGAARPAPVREPLPSPIVDNAPPSRAGGGDRSRRERSVAPPAAAPVAPPEPAPATPPARTPDAPVGERATENAGAARAQIQDVVRETLRDLGNEQTASRVLQGGSRAAWVEHAAEGRISVGALGAVDVELRGNEASASVEAEVNTRSPFGANRKRPARFVAELQRDGGAWRVVSVRPGSGFSLK